MCQINIRRDRRDLVETQSQKTHLLNLVPTKRCHRSLIESDCFVLSPPRPAYGWGKCDIRMWTCQPTNLLRILSY